MILRKVTSYFRFRVKLYLRASIHLIVAAVSIGVMLAGGHAVIDIIGGVATVLSTGLLGLDIREAWRRRTRTRIVENEDYNGLLRSCTLPKGFRMVSGHLASDAGGRDVFPGNESVRAIRPYIANDEINGVLDVSVNPLTRTAEDYAVPDNLTAYRDHCVSLRKPDFNDRKVRLASDLTPHGLTCGEVLTVQATDYFSSVATNEMACEQFETVEDSHKRRPQLVFAVSDLVVDGGDLVPLADSCLSNHIGVSTLILSQDDQLILQDQGLQCVDSNETAVGASGSVDLEDLDEVRSATLQGLLRCAMEREAAEELSARFDQSSDPTVLTGYARYLARGAKPEFFGITRSTSKASEMLPAPGERFVSGIRGIAFEPTVSGLTQAINELLDEGKTRRRRYSLSMVVCLTMARDCLQRANAAHCIRLNLSG